MKYMIASDIHGSAYYCGLLKERYFAEGAENRIYHIRGNAVSRSTSVQSGSIVEVFDFGSRFGVVINGLDSYSYLSLNLNLECYATVTVPDRTAIKVVPVSENGEQKFIVVERGKDGITVANVLAPQFAGTDVEVLANAIEKYKQIDAYSLSPIMEQEDFEHLQDVIISAGVMDSRVDFETVVDNSIAQTVLDKMK